MIATSAGGIPRSASAPKGAARHVVVAIKERPSRKPLPDVQDSPSWNPSRRGLAALLMSIAFHAALFAASGAALLVPRSATIEEPRTSVVYVHLPAMVPTRELATKPIAVPARKGAAVTTAAGVNRAHESLGTLAVSTSAAETPTPVPLAPLQPATTENAAARLDSAVSVPKVQETAVPPMPLPESSAAAYLDAPEPEYPRSAREDGEEGVVVLRVLVSRAGLPEKIVVAKTSGVRALDVAAIAGVRHWTFRPARQGYREIESWMDVPIRFRLK